MSFSIVYAKHCFEEPKEGMIGKAESVGERGRGTPFFYSDMNKLPTSETENIRIRIGAVIYCLSGNTGALTSI